MLQDFFSSKENKNLAEVNSIMNSLKYCKNLNKNLAF